MAIDIRTFYQNTDPSRTLDLTCSEDQQLYIDFSDVRTQDLIADLHAQISFFAPDQPTCQLFTGHIGCGKSTELSRLKKALIADGFHVVSFAASEDLEMGDVDVGDILLAIARQISNSLETADVCLESKGFQSFLAGINQFLLQEVTGVGVDLPGFGEVGFQQADSGFSLSMGIGKITTQAKNSPELRNKLRDYLEPRTKGIIDAINSELIEPAIAKLKSRGYAGLVVIVDNLDRVENSRKSFGTLQQEYLFVERGDQLRQLRCHLVYTIPLNLCFSNEVNRLRQRFGSEPKVLQVVPVQKRNGAVNFEGLEKLRKLVLARAFPHIAPRDRDPLILEVFDSRQTLDHLCSMTGGHVRELLMLLQSWMMAERRTPLTHEGLEDAILTRRNQLTKTIEAAEWEQLRHVNQTHQVSGEEGYQTLLRSLFVYEYCDRQGSWFAVNPILRYTKQIQG